MAKTNDEIDGGTSPQTLSADVAIIGAGPTGLVSALLLADRGHDVTLIEKWSEPYELPRAVGISHDSLHVLQVAQVIDEARPDIYFTPDGTRRREMRAGDGELLSVRFDKAESASGWPERASFSQPLLEHTLNAKASAHPRITMRRGWNATSVDERGDGATVIAQPWHGDEHGERRDDSADRLRVDARFVMGCDGANSVVRTGDLASVTDLGFAYDWLVVDVVLHEDVELTPNLGQIFGPPRPITLVLGGPPRRRRWEFMRLDGETKEGLNRAETAWTLLAPFGVHPGNATLERHAVYTFRALWADCWRSGHRVLAGDAAHLMPPFLGEGFNSGLRDAIAATWRLDLILRGVLPIDALDAYSSERVGHVRQIVEQAVAVGRMICVVDPDVAAERDTRLRSIESGAVPETTTRAWQLGEGVWRTDDEHAGKLGIQARVTVDGATGLFDDMVDRGRFVLATIGDERPQLPADIADAWGRIGGISVHFSDGSPVVDVDGTYTEWLTSRGLRAVLLRPDFYVFGTAPTADGAAELVGELVQRLGVAEPVSNDARAQQA